MADLHYADTREFATGHGVSADWNVEDEVCRRVRTRWLPVAQVEKTTTTDVFGLELGMFELGSVKDAAAVRSALAVLVDEYRRWIAHQRTGLGDLTQDRKETARQLLRHAGIAANRIERGIATLAENPDILDAFRLANRAVGRALQKRLGIDAPRWRVFQLAFILLNLPGIADPSDPQREIVDLLLLSHRWRQDGSLPRARRIHDGSSPPAPPRGQRPRWSRCERDHALHSSATNPRPVVASGRTRVRSGA